MGLVQLVVAALRLVHYRLFHFTHKQVLAGHNPVSLGANVNPHGLHDDAANSARTNCVGSKLQVARVTFNPDRVTRLTGSSVVLQSISFKGVAAGGVDGILVTKINAGASVSTGGI